MAAGLPDLSDLEARLNAVGMPYAALDAPRAQGGRVLFVSGWEVTRARSFYRLSRVLDGRTWVAVSEEEAVMVLFFNRRTPP